ncbi:ABC-type branched-chain amino acid transport system, periplasmic component [Treponema sp. JC4]|uniref:ABC transporter substrate-binding protein n=1 Tax=Treponema sp. JC4 TaxID=1124982 RepID=UPI00025B0D79|nr:ABC transporter substrate-binding protein [Treponema sp. JC4]EID85975.1 ABC-type branched-chain amino acid transport system, periplasmic component [Treponema sp. JC4]
MKKVLLGVCAALMAAAFVSCGGEKAAVVKIGVFEPASGDNGAGGKQETLGIQYANSVTPTVNIAGKEYKVQLEIVDNESSNDKAVTAASELISKGVSVVLGSYGSGVSIAASDTFAAANVPAIGVTCTNPQVTLGNEHYFRICFLDPFQGTVLANLAADKFAAKKAYCLSKLGDDYSGGLVKYFVEAFKKLGGEVVEETFPDGTSDFAAYVANAKKTGADVFFSPVSIEAAALIIEQANTQGMTLPILAGDTWDSNVVLAQAKGTKVQIYVTTFFVEGSSDPKVTSFVDGFRGYLNANATAKTNNGGDDEIAAVSAMGFDVYYTALEALKAAGSTKGADVMKALPSVTYEGVSGAIAFDQNGDAVRDVAYVKKVNNETGKWDFVAQQSVK